MMRLRKVIGCSLGESITAICILHLACISTEIRLILVDWNLVLSITAKPFPFTRTALCLTFNKINFSSDYQRRVCILRSHVGYQSHSGERPRNGWPGFVSRQGIDPTSALLPSPLSSSSCPGIQQTERDAYCSPSSITDVENPFFRTLHSNS